jgi:hypothetical protein
MDMNGIFMQGLMGLSILAAAGFALALTDRGTWAERLQRWQVFHDVRTAAAIGAFIVLLLVTESAGRRRAPLFCVSSRVAGHVRAGQDRRAVQPVRVDDGVAGAADRQFAGS